MGGVAVAPSELTPEQALLWADIDALHKAWMDRGVLVKNVTALLSAYLACVASENKLSPSFVMQCFAASYAALMERKVAEAEATP